jgi:hypothetical protein
MPMRCDSPCEEPSLCAVRLDAVTFNRLATPDVKIKAGRKTRRAGFDELAVENPNAVGHARVSS